MKIIKTNSKDRHSASAEKNCGHKLMPVDVWSRLYNITGFSSCDASMDETLTYSSTPLCRVENNTILLFYQNKSCISLSTNTSRGTRSQKYLIWSPSPLHTHYNWQTIWQDMTIILILDIQRGNRSRAEGEICLYMTNTQHVLRSSHTVYDKEPVNYKTPHISLLHSKSQPLNVIYIHEDMQMSYILTFVSVGQ